MIKLNNELLANDYTEILHEKEYTTIPCNFIINRVSNRASKRNNSIMDTLAIMNFQDGSIERNGINGIFDEDLIAIIIKRLESLQQTRHKCSEKELVLLKLEEALISLVNIRNKSNR